LYWPGCHGLVVLAWMSWPGCTGLEGLAVVDWPLVDWPWYWSSCPATKQGVDRELLMGSRDVLGQERKGEGNVRKDRARKEEKERMG